MSDARHRPCEADGCPGVEIHEGKIDGCGHPTKTSGCPWASRALEPAEPEPLTPGG